MEEKRLYVVRRGFRNYDERVERGTVLTSEEFANIKRGKIKLNEGSIMAVPFDVEGIQNYIEYFKVRVGVDIEKDLRAKSSKGSELAEPVKKVSTPPPGTTATKKAVAAKVAPANKPKPLSGAASAAKK